MGRCERHDGDIEVEELGRARKDRYGNGATVAGDAHAVCAVSGAEEAGITAFVRGAGCAEVENPGGVGLPCIGRQGGREERAMGGSSRGWQGARDG